MSAPAFPFTEDELKNIGLVGEGVSEAAALVVDTMKNHPGSLKLSLFALECISAHSHSQLVKSPSSPRSLNSPTLRDKSISSRVSALSFASDTTVVSEHTPSEYERITYYNGITSNGDHPELVFRSDFHTTPFPKPTGRFAPIPVKSLRGVFDTPLNGVWLAVGPQICDLIQANKVRWTSIDPVRFFTHTAKGEEALGDEVNGTLGPVVIWVGVRPGSTSPETAHEVSQEILALLRKNGVEGVVVEWREAEPQTLAGPPLMRHVGTGDATHYVRHFLTALLGVPLATEEMAEEDVQGTLTVWFHENKDRHGNPGNRVFGVSNCHVLRKDTATKYEHRGGAAKNHVRVCGMHRFQRGLDDITKAIADHAMLAESYARDIASQKAKLGQDLEAQKHIRQLQRLLDAEEEAAADLEALYRVALKDWSDVEMHRNIGHVHYAPPVEVGAKGPHGEIGPGYTSDWAVFVAAEAKVKAQFEGNVVDLGTKYTPEALTELFYPMSDPASTFKFPERKLRIRACATQADLAVPPEVGVDGQRYLVVGKDGNTTGLTVGRCAGLVSFKENTAGRSMELGVYNAIDKTGEDFSAVGDSGSLVWDGKGRIVGQLHSGQNRGGFTNNHITYCTPGWYLLEQIKTKFEHADFYPTTWEA